jgi:hypothetical protein
MLLALAPLVLEEQPQVPAAGQIRTVAEAQHRWMGQPPLKAELALDPLSIQRRRR